MAQNYELSNRFVSERDAYIARTKAARLKGNLRMNDPVLDEKWAAVQSADSGPSPYFDYFFTGEDIKVYFAETADEPEFGQLPIHDLSINVEQQKGPVFGYWNYTYNEVLRGTRIITGTFTLLTRYPDYMKQLLAVAARNRSRRGRDYAVPAAWSRDDENLERYWGRTLDKSASMQDVGSEWSIHPPFDLVVVYGIQGTSVDVNNLHNYFDPYESDNALLYDHNQRLIESKDKNSSRLVLEGCELLQVDRAFAPNQICAERYQFMARDILVPKDKVRYTGLSPNSGRLR